MSALGACGTLAPQAEDVEGLWVGDYGGGIAGDVMTQVDLRWSVISSEDWSGREVTATPMSLWLVSSEGLVVAVPASELTGSMPLVMSPGSEGGGGGSEGTIAISAEFVACPDGTGGLPSAPYVARLGVVLDIGTERWTASGDLPVFVPDYDSATAP